MRMRNVCEKVPTLENLKEKFLLVKQSQHTGELAMRDYRNCLADFLKHRERRYRTTEISGKRAKATYICRTMQSNWHGAGYKQ